MRCFTLTLLHFGHLNFFFSYSVTFRIKSNFLLHFSQINSYVGIITSLARPRFADLALATYVSFEYHKDLEITKDLIAESATLGRMEQTIATGAKRVRRLWCVVDWAV
jgi:hypothetical protein